MCRTMDRNDKIGNVVLISVKTVRYYLQKFITILILRRGSATRREGEGAAAPYHFLKKEMKRNKEEIAGNREKKGTKSNTKTKQNKMT